MPEWQAGDCQKWMVRKRVENEAGLENLQIGF